MNLIIAGSRSFNDYGLLCRVVDEYISTTPNLMVCIISGCAKGADQLGIRYAKDRGYNYSEHPADWDKYGKSAGHRRNTEMASISSNLIAFWDGNSKGTYDMINKAITHNINYKIIKEETC